MCLHLSHHQDLHPVSIKYVLPISDIKLSSNTTRNIHSTITFSSLSSKVLQPVSHLVSSFLTFSTSQSILPIPFCPISKCCCCLHTPLTLVCGESDHPAFGPPASLSLHLTSSSITPAGSCVVCVGVTEAE